MNLQTLFCAALLSTLTLQSSGASGADSDAFDARAFRPEMASRLVLVTFPAPPRQPSLGPRAIQYVPRGYTLSTFDARRARSLARDHDLELIAAWPIRTLAVYCMVLHVPGARTVSEALAALADDRRVAHAQAMGQFATHGARPSDPYFPLQSSFRALGIDQIHAITTGTGVRVAVVDTGVDLTHPDLVGQFDDHANFVPTISPGFAEDAHGTAVAGIVAARAGNGAGMVGIAPSARLLAYKACWPPGDDPLAAICNTFSLALALDSALVAGADVINLSLDGPRDALLAALLDEALARGVIIVAADAADPGTPSFPAVHPGVIGVRTGRAGDPAGSIAVPGDHILSTLPPNTYDFLSGCSFSAAQVTGLVALVRALDPGLPAARLAAALRSPPADLAIRLLALTSAR
ncbi:MAG: S8 family serine peptidase [Gammaproteobacteria bacterium]